MALPLEKGLERLDKRAELVMTGKSVPLVEQDGVPVIRQTLMYDESPKIELTGRTWSDLDLDA